MTMQHAGRGSGRDSPRQIGRPIGKQDSGQRGRGGAGAKRLARALGWFSLGLGLAQVAAPRGVARLIGLSGEADYLTLMRMVGLREIAAGLGILTQRWPTGWVWGRVAGDAMDLGLLGAVLGSDDARDRGKLTAATAAVVGITALDVFDSVQLSRPSGAANGRPEGHGMQVKQSITIKQSPEELYRFWRDLQNLPRFMRHLQAVRVMGERRSHWVAEAPGGKTVEWDAEIVDERPNELIAWRSLPGADVDNSGQVRFRAAPGGRGTELEVELSYDAPGGKVGRTVAKLFGKEPAQEISGDLRRLKQVIETGEIMRSDASLDSTHLAAQRPAQPPEDARQYQYATSGR